MLQDVRRELSDILSMARLFTDNHKTHPIIKLQVVYVNDKHIYATNGQFAVFFNKARHVIKAGKYLAKKIGRHDNINDVWEMRDMSDDPMYKDNLDFYSIVPTKQPTAIVSLNAFHLRKMLSQIGNEVFTIAIHDEKTIVEFNGLTKSGDQFYAMMMPMHADSTPQKIIRPEKEVLTDDKQ